MSFRFPGIFFLVLCLLFSVGCGGGDGELGMLEFGPDDEVPDYSDSPSGSQGVSSLALSVNPNVLIEIRFLYEHQVRMETLQQLNRDLTNLLEYEGPSDVDLDWVIEVHDVTEEADEFFLLVTSQRVPESQRNSYEHAFVGMLEAVQVMGLGLDRVLSAALTVGPTGRSLLHMSPREVDEFDTLIREARFYLRDSDRLVEGQLDAVGDSIGQIRLR